MKRPHTDSTTAAFLECFRADPTEETPSNYKEDSLSESSLLLGPEEVVFTTGEQNNVIAKAELMDQFFSMKSQVIEAIRNRLHFLPFTKNFTKDAILTTKICLTEDVNTIRRYIKKIARMQFMPPVWIFLKF